MTFNAAAQALLALRNFDETSVPDYRLPKSLICVDGEKVDSETIWREKRRPELLDLFERQVYGRMFSKLPIEACVVEESSDAVSGKATRRQVEIRFPVPNSPVIHVVIYLPNNAQGPVPCFLGLNFKGNHSSFDDPEIPVSLNGMDTVGPGSEQTPPAPRGLQKSRWPVEMIVDRGYALATACYGDIDPDFDDGFQNGVHPLFFAPGTKRGDYDGGAITAWAWGLSRIMDYLETIDRIDPKRVCLTGHSRLGKTSLWAGACDERFALVVLNNSGCGGGSLNRRNFGETLHILSNIRTHWFSEYCRTRSIDPEAIEVDQHQLIALIAPRPVFISCAEDDAAADPKGEFLAGLHADEVYRLFRSDGGTDGFAASEMPPLNQPVFSRIGYYIRPGEHEITPGDWKVHLHFADLHLGKA